MRPPSSLEHPAEAKMSATKDSSSFALIVTLPISGFAALQARDVAPVPGRVDHHLVDDDVRWQAGDVADQVADILGLSHTLALGRRDRDRALVEDRRRDLARADHAGADAV